MGKKKVNREKFEVPPMETEEKVDGEEIERAMDLLKAIQTPFSREREQETGNEEGEEEVEDQKKKKKKNSEEVEVPLEPQVLGQEIREELKEREVDAHKAILRLLSPEEKKQVEHIKEIWKDKDFTKEEVCEMYMQCKKDPDLSAQRLLSLETPSNSGSLLSNFSSPPSSAKSSVASQLHSVTLDKGMEVVCHVEDDAATVSRSNVRALRAKGTWSFFTVQPPLALGNIVAGSSRNDSGNTAALGSSEFLEYKLFPPPTQQYGISLMLNNLVANSDRPSELRRLLRYPLLDTPYVPSRSSAAGSQHPQTSTSENYNFTPRNNQPDPGVMSTLPKQQQGGLPIWLPLPSDGNNQHGDMLTAQQIVYQGGISSRANGNASGWGSFQGAGRTGYQSPLIPPYSPAPFNIPRTSSGSTLHTQYQYRNDYCPLTIPGPATTPHGSFPRQALLPANANNGRSGEGSSPQYDNQGGPSWQRPGTRVRPNHQQQSPYNWTTGNLQDPSSMQPPRDPGPKH